MPARLDLPAERLDRESSKNVRSLLTLRTRKGRSETKHSLGFELPSGFVCVTPATLQWIPPIACRQQLPVERQLCPGLISPAFRVSSCGHVFPLPGFSWLTKVGCLGKLPIMQNVARMTREQAQDLLRHCMEQGEVLHGPHFRNALRDEKMKFWQVHPVLTSGIVYKEPEFDVRHGDWKYVVEGRATSGEWMNIVFCFETIEDVFLVTIFRVEGR
jgi:hypothetical protein